MRPQVLAFLWKDITKGDILLLFDKVDKKDQFEGFFALCVFLSKFIVVDSIKIVENIAFTNGRLARNLLSDKERFAGQLCISLIDHRTIQNANSDMSILESARNRLILSVFELFKKENYFLLKKDTRNTKNVLANFWNFWR